MPLSRFGELKATVGALFLHHHRTGEGTIGQAVKELFRLDPELPGIMVDRADGHLLGILSRRRFNEILSSQFGWAVYANRAVRQMIDAGSRQPLVVRSDDRIEQVADLALQRPRELLYEPLIVLDAAGAPGLLDFDVLITGLSDVVRTQKDILLQTLEERDRAQAEHRAAESNLQDVEAQLRQSQKLEAIGRLAGGVAHDFNNQLQVILGHCELLDRRTRSGERDAASLEQIRKSTEHAASLTRQLLAFSRKQVMETRVIDVIALLRDLERMLRRVIGEDIHLDLTFQTESIRVKTDPVQIEQVILNIAVNARDAMPEGGCFFIGAEEKHCGRKDLDGFSDLDPGRYLRIRLRDTGCGMDAATREQVFEPFFTTKGMGEGTGLGLSTAYGIVKQSGGDIRCLSEPGRGTAFEILLPVVDTPEEREPGLGSASRERIGGTETILVAEDEDYVRDLVRSILEDEGYTIILAADGQEALAAGRNHSDGIDLLISDMVMPYLNGRQLSGILRELLPGLKTLYISGYTGDEIADMAELNGQSCFLQKPFSGKLLLHKVREILDSEEHAERPVA